MSRDGEEHPPMRLLAIFRDTLRHSQTPANSSIPIVHDSRHFRASKHVSSRVAARASSYPVCLYPHPRRRASRISMRPLRATNTFLARLFTYASVRCTCTYARRCRTEHKDSRLSFLFFDMPGDGRPVLHALIFDAARILMLHSGRAIRMLIHHARVHLSNGIGADLSGILTTTVQHICAYGWRESHHLPFR